MQHIMTNNVEIKKLLLFVTRTYNKIYKRDFNLNVTAGVLNSLSDYSHPTYTTGAVTLNEIDLVNKFPNLVTYSGNILGEASIPNGWATERIRFLMEVETNYNGINMVYLLQGFTEFHDPSINGHIDDHMLFFINSVTQFRKVLDPISGFLKITPYETYQILTNNNNKYQEIVQVESDDRVARPQDILTSLYIDEAWTENKSRAFNMTDIIMPDNVKTSRRKNNNPLNYVTTTINSYKNVLDSTSDEFYTSNIYQSAANSITEPDINNNLFILEFGRRLNKILPTSFTLAELQIFDPMIVHKVQKVDKVTQDNIDFSSALDSDYTESNMNPTPEVMKASYLANVIPSLMLDCLLFVVSVNISNSSLEPIIAVVNANTVIGDLDVLQSVSLFENKLRTLVMPKLTDNNLTSIDVNIKCEVIGDISIFISVNGGPNTLFRFPTFADSTYSPMVTTKEKKDVLYEDFSHIIDATYGVQIPSPSIDTVHFSQIDGLV